MFPTFFHCHFLHWTIVTLQIENNCCCFNYVIKFWKTVHINKKPKGCSSHIVLDTESWNLYLKLQWNWCVVGIAVMRNTTNTALISPQGIAARSVNARNTVEANKSIPPITRGTVRSTYSTARNDQNNRCLVKAPKFAYPHTFHWINIITIVV